MSIKKVTFTKDWNHPSGHTIKKGECAKCTPELVEELEKGGYIAAKLKTNKIK